MEIKQQNYTNVFQQLRRIHGMTRQDLAISLQLSLPTVTQNIRKLQEEGLVEESGSMGNTGGRKAKRYDIVKAARVAVGLDITRNHVTIVLVDLTGNIIFRARTRRKFQQEDDYYRYLGELVEQAVSNAHLPHSSILGVGIGVPGLVTRDHQSVFYGKILNFTGATCAEFSKYISYPSALFNDANAAGFAESWSHQESFSAFYLMLSNNVGGSVVLDGRVYDGQNLRSGEVGHICIVPNGRPCYCGQRGCVDAYLAATELSSHTEGNLAAFFSLLESGDPSISDIWNNYLDHMARTVNTLNMLFDCTIILGGYVGEYIAGRMDEIRSRAEKLNTFEHNADYLVCCSYQTEAIAAGAALYFISRFIDSI